MRPVIFGALTALAVGVLALAALIAAANARPPLAPPTPTARPGSSPLGLYTPTPGPSPTASPTGSPTASTGTSVGSRAPRLLLPHLAGGELDTDTAAGTPLWINFMATWSPQSRDELPLMQEIDLSLGDELEVILVDVAEDGSTVLSFMLGLGVDLPTALDSDGAAQREWGAFVLPVHYFIDDQGIVQAVVFGGAPGDVFIEAVEKIVPGADINIEP
jgi:thiol-disulfide isomerase/thioredoxin